MNEGDLRVSLHRLANTVPTSDPMPSLRRRRRKRRTSGALTVVACAVLALTAHQVVSEKLGGDEAVAAAPEELMPLRSGNLRLVEQSVVTDQTRTATAWMVDGQAAVLRFASQCTDQPATVSVTVEAEGSAARPIEIPCAKSITSTETPVRELFGSPPTATLMRILVVVEVSPSAPTQVVPGAGVFVGVGSYLPGR